MRTFFALFFLLCPVVRAGDVVFREDFEQFNPRHWDDISGWGDSVKIVDNGHHGKCLQATATAGKNTGGSLFRMLAPGLDTCHLRFYVKFDANHGYTHHFVHLCAYNPPTRWPQGGAGEKPRGDERFTTGIEPWGQWGKSPPPGVWHLYSYWNEMTQAPDGKYWGNFFDPKPAVPVERDKWICVEVMVQCNSAPDKSDGQQAFWIDGKEAGRWTGIRWRTDPKLKINGIWILDYITDLAGKQNPGQQQPKVNTVWFDDIVVSTAYIGPAPSNPTR